MSTLRETRQMFAAPGWVVEHAAEDGTYTEHLGGVPWHEAPSPPREHDCTPQTRGRTAQGSQVDRCRCGGLRYRGGPWLERNGKRD